MDVDKLEGRELDAAVAREIYGWDFVKVTRANNTVWGYAPGRRAPEKAPEIVTIILKDAKGKPRKLQYDADKLPAWVTKEHLKK